MVRKSKTQVLFRKGDTLTKQGAFALYILFLISGVVKQYIYGSDNRSFNRLIIQAGEFNLPSILQLMSLKDFAGISTKSAVKLLKSFEKEDSSYFPNSLYTKALAPTMAASPAFS
ncbi:MAG TPA: hypothetical protein VFP20_03050 [Bacteroidales bacterium]|nr:hypothetical protein [Bacteroidales bacterium]